MLALRFANGIFEPIWNRQFIDHVQITVAESIGIEGRAALLRAGGRDPRHLPEPPAPARRADRDGAADRLHRRLGAQREGEGAELDPHAGPEVRRPRPVRARSSSRARRCPATARSRASRPTRPPRPSSPRSSTSTTGAGPTRRSTCGWGSACPRRETTIAIQFKRAPHPPFEETAAEGLRPNVLLVHVQPDEGVSLAIGAKVPGQGMSIRTVHMDFLYGGAFRDGPARGVRAPDPRRDPRRRDPLHPRRRGRGAVVARRRDHRRVAARPARLPELPGRHLGPAQRRRAPPQRRAIVATALTEDWTGEDVTIAEIEHRLAELRDCDGGRGGAVPAHERDDALRLGAGGVGRRRARGPRRARRAPPVADDRPVPATPTRARRDRRGRVAPVLPLEGSHARRLRRGRRAPPARAAREGSGSIVRRSSSPTCRRSSLARRAAVRHAGARAARGRRRSHRLRLDRVGRPAVRYGKLARSSSASPSRTSPGGGRSSGASSWRASGRESRRRASSG